MKYGLSCYAQLLLWVVGINKHNKYADECTPDFSCCTDIRTPFGKRLVYALLLPISSYRYRKACKRL